MNSAEFVQSGRLEEGLSALQAEIRQKPEDLKLRVFLFQLNCILGRFEKALTQLQVVASLNAESMLLAQIFRPIIACEMLRKEVFAGVRTPVIFGEPMEWMGLIVQANSMIAQGEFKAASNLRERAFASAPASEGTINGEPFAWIADADSRLGPVWKQFWRAGIIGFLFAASTKSKPKSRRICGIWFGCAAGLPGLMEARPWGIFRPATLAQRKQAMVPCVWPAKQNGRSTTEKPSLDWDSASWRQMAMNIHCWNAAVLN